jgi:hypothetical protein
MALVDRPNWIRITMSGPFGVGKTSLVRSLLGQAFVPDYESTEGIEIGDHQLGTLVDMLILPMLTMLSPPPLSAIHPGCIQTSLIQENLSLQPTCHCWNSWGLN